jgi:hypothetical protein
MRISRYLNPTTWLVGQLFCLQAASAQTVMEKLESKPSGLHPSVSTSYLRSAADQDSAYYQSIAALEFNVGYALADYGNIALSTGVSRDLDALEEINNWSSTSLSYASLPIVLAEKLRFRYSGTVVAPTNSEMRDYLSYRGSLGAGASLSRTWSGLPVGKSITVGLSGNAVRNFFKYDASEAGVPNTVVALGSALSASFDINDMIQLSGEGGIKRALKSNGTRMPSRFEHEFAAAVNLTKELSVSVSETTENRAYSYDAQTTEFALYDFRTTLYELAATYTF